MTEPTQPQAPQLDQKTYLKKLSKLQVLAPMYGYNREDVDRFVSQKRGELFASSGIPVNEIVSDPVIQGIQAQQVAEGTYKAKGGGDEYLTDAYAEQLKTGSLRSLTGVPTEDRGAVVKQLTKQGVNIADLDKKRQGETVVGITKQLKDVFENQKLAGGRAIGGVNQLRGVLGAAPQVTRYNDLRKGAIAAFRELTGDKGVLTETDANRIVGLLPKPTNTAKEAELKWEDLNKFIQSKYGVNILDQEQKTTPASKASTGGKVRVQSPDGKVGSIDQSELKDSLAAGWMQL